MADYPLCRLASWKDVDRWIDELTRRIQDGGHAPEVIVGVTRGGWVPARLLADRLRVRKVLALRTQHWGITATRDGRAQLTDGLSGPVRGESVLVVDDITDTGESLALAVEHVRESAPSLVETATCLHITHSKFVPTYHAEEIHRDHWVWVVFPWTYWEDLRTLAGRAFEDTHSVAKAHRALAERCQLKVPRSDIARALAGRELSRPESPN